jgi:FtsH-binding integral membrane protein
MDNTTSPKSNESIITDHYINYRKDKIRALEKKINKSRNTLFIVAVFALIAGLIQIAIIGYNDGREFKYTIFIALVFVALGFFTKKEPFAALVMSLIIYIGLWALTIAIGGPEYIFKGIIGKAIIIFFIASGIPHAQEAEDLKKELKEIKE